MATIWLHFASRPNFKQVACMPSQTHAGALPAPAWAGKHMAACCAPRQRSDEQALNGILKALDLALELAALVGRDRGRNDLHISRWWAGRSADLGSRVIRTNPLAARAHVSVTRVCLARAWAPLCWPVPPPPALRHHRRSRAFMTRHCNNCRFRGSG